MAPDFPAMPKETGAPDERYDRQVRIPGWDQEKLARARVGVAGDDPWLTGLFVAAAAALGLNRLTVAAPDLDPRLIAAARGLNPELDLAFFPGFLSHTFLEDVFRGCDVLVDLGHCGLITKLLLNLAHREGLPLVRGWEFFEEGGAAGVRLFTYLKGREWRELLKVVPRVQLPFRYRGDPVLALVIAGLVLEETKKLLQGEKVTPEVVTYSRRDFGNANSPNFRGGSGGTSGPSPSPHSNQACPIAVIGAGALGNFVGLGLAALGFGPLTIIDPDPVEVTNLNRQILFWDAVGEPKARALAGRIREWFGTAPEAQTAYVTRETDLSRYAAVFDCTDNFASRIVLSEKCKKNSQVLVSGGTGVAEGQVVVFDPARDGPTPAELLGLYDLVGRQDPAIRGRPWASCLYAPEPAVIIS